jgi:hypothetical protein
VPLPHAPRCLDVSSCFDIDNIYLHSTPSSFPLEQTGVSFIPSQCPSTRSQTTSFSKRRVGWNRYLYRRPPLCHRSRNKLLVPLVLCSRRLNRIANPVLYTAFVQTGEQALPAFLSLLTEKPEMGAHVKRFVALETGEPAHINMRTVSR